MYNFTSDQRKKVCELAASTCAMFTGMVVSATAFSRRLDVYMTTTTGILERTGPKSYRIGNVAFNSSAVIDWSTTDRLQHSLVYEVDIPGVPALLLPQLIFVAGKKRAGKDTLCDSLLPFGYTKLHIAEPWLRTQCYDLKISYEDEYLPNKGQYRDIIQRRATRARQDDPYCLIRHWGSFEDTGKCVVSGIRFVNEADWGMDIGAFVVLVTTPDEIRAQRFQTSCENLNSLNDPFESEIDELPYHLSVSGTINPTHYPKLISKSHCDYISVDRGYVYAFD